MGRWTIWQKSQCKGPEATGWSVNSRNNKRLRQRNDSECAMCNPQGKRNRRLLNVAIDFILELHVKIHKVLSELS